MSLLYLSERDIKFSLKRNLVIHTWLFPGQWVSDIQLLELKTKIEDFTLKRIGVLPQYGIYLAGRKVWNNRIITIVYDNVSGTVKGFSAMVFCPVTTNNRTYPIMHLGLVMLERHHAFRNLLFSIYYLPLLFFSLLRELKPFWITSVSMEPPIIGLVADCFDNVYPHYSEKSKADKNKIEIAQSFFANYRGEFGAGPDSIFNQNNFVIEGSCRGPSEILRVDFKRAARYIARTCNEFCIQTLNYERGDELLQIGMASPISIFRAPINLLKIRREWHKK